MPLTVALLAIGVAPSSAQPLSQILTFLVTNQSVATGSVERDRAAAQAASDTISRALLTSLATLPVATSSGAFVYRLNPALGTFERSTENFGAFMVERALTAGPRSASVALTYQHLRFTSLDGLSLRNGTLVTTANQFVDEAQPFDTDRLTLDIAADVATISANVGVTNHLEVSGALPVVALHLNGTRIDTYRGTSFTEAVARSTAVGPADAAARAKYTVYDRAGSGVALAIDARLPTGRDQDLLGAGSASVKVSAISSVEAGRMAAHGNVGASLGGLEREFAYAGAGTWAASDKVTLTGELLGRWIPAATRLTFVSANHPTLSGVRTIRLASGASGLHIVNLTPGLKWNVAGTWIVDGNVTVPLTEQGLTTAFTPFIGLEYAIGR